MSGKTPILSLCIPTYNRLNSLRECLQPLLQEAVKLPAGEVEIVVADNGSTDGTEAFCRELQSVYPTLFVYFRRAENAGYEANIITLLELAHGEFLKFLNDVFYFLPGKLAEMLEIIRAKCAEQPLLFFTNGAFKAWEQPCKRVCTHDDLLRTLSYQSTWIGGFGVWQEDVALAKEVHQQAAKTLISQTAVLWACFDKRRAAVICNTQFFGTENSNKQRRGGYNIAEVFGHYYPAILRPYVEAGAVTKAAYQQELHKLYKKHIFRRYFDFKGEFNFYRGNFFSFTKVYHTKVYFWLSLLRVPVYSFRRLIGWL